MGSPEVKKIDVRLIAATNRDLRSEVLGGRFREDLFFRLNAIEIRVPGLTDRAEDIPVLVQHFLKKYNEAYGKSFQGLTRRAQIAILQHDWPGNVRELENAIERAVVLGSTNVILPEDLPEALLDNPASASESPPTRYHEGLQEAKKQMISRALEQSQHQHHQRQLRRYQRLSSRPRPPALSVSAILKSDRLQPLIGIGGSLATSPLPHHRTYGSVSGGSMD